MLFRTIPGYSYTILCPNYNAALTPNDQNSPKALCSLVFGPKSLRI